MAPPKAKSILPKDKKYDLNVGAVYCGWWDPFLKSIKITTNNNAVPKTVPKVARKATGLKSCGDPKNVIGVNIAPIISTQRQVEIWMNDSVKVLITSDVNNKNTVDAPKDVRSNENDTK